MALLLDQETRRSLEIKIPQIRIACESDCGRLIEILVDAFDNDPLTRWFVLEDKRRPERLRRLFTWYLSQTLPLHLSHTTEDQNAVALWLGPGQWKLSLYRQIQFLPKIIRVVGLHRAISRIRGVDAFQRKHPTVPHYYLAVLGTAPAVQGRGFGSAILQAGLSRCDKKQMPAYLETSTERNLPLYERHGFRVIGEVNIPHDGPTVWLMWRDPQTADLLIGTGMDRGSLGLPQS